MAPGRSPTNVASDDACGALADLIDRIREQGYYRCTIEPLRHIDPPEAIGWQVITSDRRLGWTARRPALARR
jgi:hypothetical protein